MSQCVPRRALRRRSRPVPCGHQRASTGCGTAARPPRRSGRRGPSAGRPPAGYFTKRLAEDWLRSVLDQARRGVLPGMMRTGATFADAASEWLRYLEQDRGRKPPTLQGYRSALRANLLPASGSVALEDVTTEAIESWLAAFDGSARTRTSCSSSSTAFFAGRGARSGFASARSPERASPSRGPRLRFQSWTACSSPIILQARPVAPDPNSARSQTRDPRNEARGSRALKVEQRGALSEANLRLTRTCYRGKQARAEGPAPLLLLVRR